MPTKEELRVIQDKLHALLSESSPFLGPRLRDEATEELTDEVMPNVFLMEWFAVTAWMDADGEWWYTRLSSPGMTEHSRIGLSKLAEREEWMEGE